MLRAILKSKLFVAAGLIVLLSTGYFFARELQKKSRIHREIRDLEGEIEKFESQNEEILRLINYFKTPEYKERQARSLLNLQKPGEFAVALPPSEEDMPSEASLVPAETKSNLKAWWDYFFGASH